MTENENNDLTIPPELLAQLQQYDNLLNPKLVAVTIIAVKSNGTTEIQSAYNPNGLYISISDEAPQLGNVEETPETED